MKSTPLPQASLYGILIVKCSCVMWELRLTTGQALAKESHNYKIKQVLRGVLPLAPFAHRSVR